jgi:nucleoside-diphosphate-sugar epimerase
MRWQWPVAGDVGREPPGSSDTIDDQKEVESMKVLFVGGTGVISSACSRLAVQRGMDVFLLNRGQTERPVPEGARILYGDIRDRRSAEQAMGDSTFDVVVNWINFIPEQVEADLELFGGRTGHYIFISSASAYQKPLSSLPITESTPLDNPFWEYSRAKAACEERLMRAYRQKKFPVTIVRPSHTYDRTKVPLFGHYTDLDRMRKGKKVIVHGDGTSLWVLTHHEDFAKGFVGLLGNDHAIGHAFHITSDELLTWNQIYAIMAQTAGVEPRVVHIPSDFIAAFDAEAGAGLLGDKAHSVIFDNSKIKRLVPDYAATIPFSQGAREIVTWFDADPARQVVDEQTNRLVDSIIAAYEGLRPGA